MPENIMDRAPQQQGGRLAPWYAICADAISRAELQTIAYAAPIQTRRIGRDAGRTHSARTLTSVGKK